MEQFNSFLINAYDDKLSQKSSNLTTENENCECRGESKPCNDHDDMGTGLDLDVSFMTQNGRFTIHDSSSTGGDSRKWSYDEIRLSSPPATSTCYDRTL